MEKTFIKTVVAISFSCLSFFCQSCSTTNSESEQEKPEEGYWIASMDEQVTSMKEILKCLQDANTQNKNPESGDPKLGEKITDLEERIKNISDWESACNASYYTAEDLGNLESSQGNLISEAKRKATSAAGKVMENIYVSKMNAGAVLAQIRNISAEHTEIQSFINFMNDYDKKVLEIMNKSLEEDGFVNILTSQELDQMAKEAENQIQMINEVIDDLKNRIQSLSFIPSKTINDEPFMGITLNGNDWYSWYNAEGKEHFEYFDNTQKGLHRATLKYKVLPAYMAPEVTAENTDFVVKRLSHPELSEKPEFKIEKIEAVQENGEYTGEINIEVTTDYVFTFEEKYDNWTSSTPVTVFSMTLMANIKGDKQDHSAISDEITVDWTNGYNAMESVWFVEGTDSGWNTALKENYHYKKLYSDTEKREFYGNWAFMKVNKKDPSNYKFTPVSEVYPRFKVSLEPVDSEGNIITDMTDKSILPSLESANPDNNKAYTFGAKTIQINEGMNTKALIGDKIKSNKFGVVISIFDKNGKLLYKERTWVKQSFQETVEIVETL